MTPFALSSPTQKAFHADVVSVMRRWLKEEVDEKPTIHAREHYAKVIFPPYRRQFRIVLGCPNNMGTCFVKIPQGIKNCSPITHPVSIMTHMSQFE